MFKLLPSNWPVQVDNPEGSRLRKFQEWMKAATTFTLPMFHGRGIFQYTYGLIPYRDEGEIQQRTDRIYRDALKGGPQVV